MRTRIALLVTVATVAMSASIAEPAFAQESPPAEPADSYEGIETIVVTAQKRSEDSQKVPATVTTLDASTLSNQQITEVADLIQAVPGFAVVKITGTAAPFLRGMGLSSSGPWQEVPVSTYVDGVYIVNPAVNLGILNNLERVEVLKGPQGTLFGRNATGGVVSYVTRDPTHDLQVDAEVGYGNYNTLSGNFYASTGITDTLAADIAIAGEDQRDGWGKNLYSGKDIHTGSNYAVRTKWVLKPSAPLKATFSADYNRISPPEVGNGSVRDVYPFITKGPHHSGGFYDAYLPQEPTNRYTLYGTSLNLQYDAGFANLVSITAYRESKARLNGPDEFDVPYLPATPSVGQVSGIKISNLGKLYNRTFTQELQLVSPSTSKIRWVAGLFYLGDTSGVTVRNDLRPAPTGVINQRAITKQTTRSYSGFAEATLPLFAESTHLTLGARYTSDHRWIEGRSEINTVANPNVYTVRPGTTAADNPAPNKTWSKPTYKVSLDHQLGPGKLIYASFSTGFQSAFYTISNDANRPPLEPTTLKAYEIGLKSYFFRRTVRLNIAAFRYDLKNVVVSANPNGQQQQRNAASSRIRGIDMDLTYQPVRDLSFTAAMQVIDPKYVSYPGAVVYVPAGNAYVVTTADLSGSQLQWTEKVQASLNGNYVIPSSAGDFSLNGGVTYHSGMHFDPQNLLVQPKYTIFNASIGWTSPSQAWTVRLWGKNLSNRKYVSALQGGTAEMKYNPAEPRTFGVRIGYKFH